MDPKTSDEKKVSESWSVIDSLAHCPTPAAVTPQRFLSCFFFRFPISHWYQINDKIQFLIYWLNSSRQSLLVGRRRLDNLQQQHLCLWQILNRKIERKSSVDEAKALESLWVDKMTGHRRPPTRHENSINSMLSYGFDFDPSRLWFAWMIIASPPLSFSRHYKLPYFFRTVNKSSSKTRGRPFSGCGFTTRNLKLKFRRLTRKIECR